MYVFITIFYSFCHPHVKPKGAKNFSLKAPPPQKKKKN